MFATFNKGPDESNQLERYEGTEYTEHGTKKEFNKLTLLNISFIAHTPGSEDTEEMKTHLGHRVEPTITQ